MVLYVQGLVYKLALRGFCANTVQTCNTYVKRGTWTSIEGLARRAKIARGMVYVSSPASRFTTGINLVTDDASTKVVQLKNTDFRYSGEEI